ncbi:DEAD/DEAH box helicase family protein [Bacillus paranthracis]|uniref:DEAD/DEAH box helicase family protein n=1 Tax=Bacillus paranthracis TaxID=2026186 RepID=UPI0022E12CBD|nr:DEAD/DEAH box helicase family protein [Bacillus paranthracis]MED0977009.1 DEAD/DEAH box helicase family protein [Bacillus paranthracis]MED1137668.1 DEAD/DEAH box helicase family protein [Bacillus paranthracis]
MENKIYVSDIITTDVVEELERGKNYLIGSEMNSGKNYWVRYILLPYALENNKKTLVLSHRTQTKEQQENYLEEYKWECIRQFRGGEFELRTYQQFQNMIKKNDSMIHSFDYIVCDEAHYFVSDSSFNTRTELAFNFLNQNDKAVKIFMTATSEGLYYLPWNNELEVLKEANFYNNQVKDLYRYEQNETVLSVVHNEIEEGKKVLVYHNAIDTTSDFNIGNSKVLHSGNRENSLEFKQIVENRQFECDVLNTTKLMTEATEIKDDSVETVVIHGISDIDTFVQATGRVRNHKVNVYYKRISKKSILAKLRYLEKQLFYYDEFTILGEIEFIKEYGLDIINKQMKAFYLDTIIDSISHQQYPILRVHTTGLAYLEYQAEIYSFMNAYGFEAFFDKYFPNIAYVDLEQLKKENYIQLDIIDNYINKKIFKQQQEELIGVICNKYGLRAKNGSRKVGMKTINSFFEENNIPFIIESKKESKGEHRNKMYWLLNMLN